MQRVLLVSRRLREVLVAWVFPAVVFAICRFVAASWYAVDLSGIPDEGPVPVSLLPWFLYSYDSGGGLLSDEMRVRTWLVSCAGYLIPPFLAAFGAHRTSVRLGAIIVVGGLIAWAIVCVPSLSGQATYDTATNVRYGRLWILALAVLGVGLGAVASRMRSRSPGRT